MNFSHNFKKSFGQNFLKDPNYAKQLVKPLNLTKDDFVIEVGPGDGAITKIILNTDAKVLAVDIDFDLVPKLIKKFSDYENFNIEHNNILNIDIEQIAKKYKVKKIKVVGSLPYNISKRIISMFLLHNFNESNVSIECMSFIIQKEVAESYASITPKMDYLGAFAKSFSNVKKYKNIPKKLFYPQPKVDGAIIYFEPKQKDLIDFNLKEYVSFLKVLFTNPRKTISNNLKNLKLNVADIIKKADVLPSKRAAELSLEEIMKLYKAL